MTTAAKVLVPRGQLDEFRARLERLSKKAFRFGLEPIKIASIEHALYTRRTEYVGNDAGKKVTTLVAVEPGRRVEHPIIMHRVSIEYPVIQLGCWAVVGQLQAVSSGGAMMFASSADVADTATLKAYADKPLECEHCKTQRYRKEAYLLRELNTDNYRLVGSSCLADFTGHDPAAALFLAKMVEFMVQQADELQAYAASSLTNAVDAIQYLADVSFSIDTFGFVSVTKAKESNLVPTWREALTLLQSTFVDHEVRAAHVAQMDRHLKRAEAALAWVMAKPEEGEFDYNVKTILKAPVIAAERQYLSFAAAAMQMYIKAQAQAGKESMPSLHIGEPGQKMACALTIDHVVQIEGAFGTADLVIMHDASGNKVVWRAHNCPPEVRRGAGRTMAATFKVKEHGVYKGDAQTTVTHLKVGSWVDTSEGART